jgi:hypothetical protein
MRRLAYWLIGVLMLNGGLFGKSAAGDVFGSGTSIFEIEFVTIGQPGNPADTTGSPNPAGAVPYEYRIGKYEISEQMIDNANALGGLGITKDTRGPNKSATRVNWFEAALFVNWLNTSSGYAPAYKFDIDRRLDFDNGFELWTPADVGFDPSNRFRNRLAGRVHPFAVEPVALIMRIWNSTSILICSRFGYWPI